MKQLLSILACIPSTVLYQACQIWKKKLRRKLIKGDVIIFFLFYRGSFVSTSSQQASRLLAETPLNLCLEISWHHVVAYRGASHWCRIED
jgi:hypothetical protein